MARWRVAFVLIFLGLSMSMAVDAATSRARAASRGDSTQDDSIDALLNSEKGVVQSVQVVRLSDGKTLFEKNPNKLVAPASVTKLVTSAAVLSRFTPVRTFTTRLYYTGGRKQGHILGDLIIVGDGDPFVVSEKLWQLAADIKHLGITDFAGDIVIDNSLFDDRGRDASRLFGREKSHNAYDAPVSAFGVNFNTFAIAVAPDTKIGKPAFVGIDPYPIRNVHIDNRVQTSGSHGSKNIQITRLGGPESMEERLVATGSISNADVIQRVYRSVGDYVETSGEYVRAFLKAAGITVRGKVREGDKPANATPLIDMESYEVRRMVAGLNTFSNNYIADVLVKRLGAEFPRKGRPTAPGSGNFANGIHVIADFLRNDVGIKSDFVLKNGSGLSTDNRLSASQITAVLSYMEKHMEVFPEYLASLPATGWDGTLKKRFSKGDALDFKGLFRAKSGTLTEPVAVAGLAGYFRHPKHGLVAFCILENGSAGKKQPAIVDLRARQDQVLVALLNQM